MVSLCEFGFWLQLANPRPGLWCVCLCTHIGFSTPILGGVLGCACLCACCACSPPILAGVCGVCVWVPGFASARQSWLWLVVCVYWYRFCFHPTNPGWGVRVCLFVCALRLYPADPGWGLWCIWSDAVLGSCRKSWLGFVVWVSAFRFCFHPANPALGVVFCVFLCALCLFPANPGRGLGCLCSGAGFGLTPPIVARVCGVYARCGFYFDPTTRGWCVEVCVFVCVLRLYAGSPGWGLRCVSSGAGFGFIPSILAGVLGCTCLCAMSACTMPMLAGLCSAFIWVPIRASGRQSWPEFVACSLGYELWAVPANRSCGVWVCMFVCALSLFPADPSCGSSVCVFEYWLLPHPASPGWNSWFVCLGTGFAFNPPILAWLLGCVCFCARSARTWPIRAGVCDVCVCVQVMLSPRQSWLRCWGLCACVRALPVPGQSWPESAVRVFRCGFGLHLANPGSSLRFVCLGLGFAFTPPILPWVAGCTCLCAGCACSPPLLAGACGVWVWVRVLASPGNPCSGFWCVCLNTGFAFTPLILAGVCGVCVRVQVLASPRKSWLWFVVCVSGFTF